MVERRKKTFNIISKRFLESIIDDVSSIYVGGARQQHRYL